MSTTPTKSISTTTSAEPRLTGQLQHQYQLLPQFAALIEHEQPAAILRLFCTANSWEGIKVLSRETENVTSSALAPWLSVETAPIVRLFTNEGRKKMNVKSVAVKKRLMYCCIRSSVLTLGRALYAIRRVTQAGLADFNALN